MAGGPAKLLVAAPTEQETFITELGRVKRTTKGLIVSQKGEMRFTLGGPRPGTALTKNAGSFSDKRSGRNVDITTRITSRGKTCGTPKSGGETISYWGLLF